MADRNIVLARRTFMRALNERCPERTFDAGNETRPQSGAATGVRLTPATHASSF